MFCGRRSLRIIDDAGHGHSKSTPPKKKKATTNPYATVGLHKFSDLLADLDARRATIMANARPEEASSIGVRFTYSGSNEIVPIILRRHGSCSECKSPATAAKLLADDGKSEITIAVKESALANGEMKAASSSPDTRKEMKKSSSWCLREVLGWPRWNLWLLVLVLILSSLLMLGRVFAICCTTIWWYSLPFMAREGNDGDQKRFTKKKEQVIKGRKRSENSMVVKHVNNYVDFPRS